MPKVTFTMTEVVWIKIKGEKVEHTPEAGKPYLNICPNDGGLVRRFMDFQEKETIFPVSHLSCGGGQFEGLFTAEDAAKIEAWLEEQGAERR